MTDECPCCGECFLIPEEYWHGEDIRCPHCGLVFNIAGDDPEPDKELYERLTQNKKV